MADDPKSNSAPTPEVTSELKASAESDKITSLSPAPADVTEEAPAKPGVDTDASQAENAGEPDKPASTMPADPLSDGTVPTVLAAGNSHRSVAKGQTSIASIYRRADIMTTLLTFAGAAVAALIIFFLYAYFTRAKAVAPTTPGKVTQLNKSDIDKLGAFFEGNAAGNSTQVLTVTSSALFKNRAAFGSDVRVVGGLGVTGTTALSDLTVDKTSTLGVTGIRGSLTVAGPVNLQSPATLSGGASITGNITASGNGSFGGSLSAGVLNIRDLSVAGTLNLAGHLSVTGASPTATPGTGAGAGASAQVDGNDSSGTVTINTGNLPTRAGIYNSGGLLVTVNFHTAYQRSPRVIIAPIGAGAAGILPYTLKTANNFIVGGVVDAHANTSYSFDYWVVQ